MYIKLCKNCFLIKMEGVGFKAGHYKHVCPAESSKAVQLGEILCVGHFHTLQGPCPWACPRNASRGPHPEMPPPPSGTKCCLLNRPSFLLLMPLCHFRVGSSFISIGLLSNRSPSLHCLCFVFLKLLFSQGKSYGLTLAVFL